MKMVRRPRTKSITIHGIWYEKSVATAGLRFNLAAIATPSACRTVKFQSMSKTLYTNPVRRPPEMTFPVLMAIQGSFPGREREDECRRGMVTEEDEAEG